MDTLTAELILEAQPVTLRQVVRRKVTKALTVAAVFLALLLVFIHFAGSSEWGWVSAPLTLGVMVPLLYVVLMVDCPKCHSIFGQRHILNVAFHLPFPDNSGKCPHCRSELDASL
jgi:hypothetical protein